MKLTFEAAQVLAVVWPAIPVVLDAAVKSVVILVLGGVTVLCLRRASAATRHLVWFLAMASLLLLPVLSAILPGWHILPNWIGKAQSTPELNNTEPFANTTKLHEATDVSYRQDSPSLPPGISQVRQITETSAESFAASSSVAKPTSTRRVGLSSWSMLAWLTGSLLALVPTVLGMLSLWHLGRRARRVTERNWLELLQRLLRCIGSKQNVALLKSSRRRMPMTWGWLRPKLLLPDEVEDWPEERRRVVLLHELAHVKRWDYLTNLITQIVCALYWFNPLVWVASRRMVTERERACDDMVLSQGAKPADYADQVLQLASGLKLNPFAAYGGVAMARPSKLEGRLLAILDGHRNRRAVTRLAVLISVILLTAVVFPLAMMRATAQNSAGNSSHLSFVPTVERTLTGAKDEWGLDLDSGRTSGPVVIGGETQYPQDMDLSIPYWKKDDEFTVASVASDNDLVAIAAPNEEWNISPEQLRARLKPSLAGRVVGAGSTHSSQLVNPQSELPRTFLFRTTKGNAGVLQLLAFTQKPGGVRLRYKLLAAKAEANTEATTSANALGSSATKEKLAQIQRSFATQRAMFQRMRFKTESAPRPYRTLIDHQRPPTSDNLIEVPGKQFVEAMDYQIDRQGRFMLTQQKYVLDARTGQRSTVELPIRVSFNGETYRSLPGKDQAVIFTAKHPYNIAGPLLKPTHFMHHVFDPTLDRIFNHLEDVKLSQTADGLWLLKYHGPKSLEASADNDNAYEITVNPAQDSGSFNLSHASRRRFLALSNRASDSCASWTPFAINSS